MTPARVSPWSTAAQSALGAGAEAAAESGRDEFYDHLLNVCVLLLLQESPETAAALPERLRPLGFETTVKAAEAALDRLRDAGLVRPGDGASGRYAVTADGREWLRRATKDLRRTEVVLGGFLARCGERLISLT